MAQAKITHETKIVALSELKEFPGNPNIHPEEQIKAIAASIDQYGQYYPIITDEKLQILCGHGKKLALEYKEATTAQITILHGMTEKQKMKLVLTDNKTQSMSYINYGKVEDIIREIGEVDIIGFGTDYLDAIIHESTASTDNMGVDYSQKAETKQNYTPEQVAQEQDERDSIEVGMQSARTMTCPHCGKEIIL